MTPAEGKGTLAGALLSLVAAGLGLGTAFGLHITTQEHDAILTFSGAIALAAPLVGALFDHAKTRAKVIVQPSTTAQAAALQAQIEELQRQKEALA